MPLNGKLTDNFLMFFPEIDDVLYSAILECQSKIPIRKQTFEIPIDPLSQFFLRTSVSRLIYVNTTWACRQRARLKLRAGLKLRARPKISLSFKIYQDILISRSIEYE